MSTIKSLYQGMFKLYRWPLLALVVLFGLGIILGVVVPINLKLILLDAVMQKFTAIIGDASTSWQLTQRIFINNFLVSLLLYGLGFTMLFPIIMVVINGVIIGLFLSLMYRLDTIMPGTFWSSIISLAPHGVFELTAFFLSGALSIIVLIKIIFTKQLEPHKLRRQVLLESVIRWFTLVVPLLMVAALMEGFVSPRVGTAVSAWLYQRHFTPTLAITPAPTFLTQHNCTAMLNTDTKQSLGTGQTNNTMSLAQAVYDPATYQLLKQRATIPSWEQYYSCDNNLTIGLKSYPTQQWSLQQATLLQTAFLQASNIYFYSPEDDPYTFQTEQAGITNTISIRQVEDKTVVVALSDDTITIDQILEQ